MTDITTFPTIQNVLYSGDNVVEMIAEEAVTKGNAVGINATTKAVMPVTTDEEGIGVALTTQATVNGKVLVALSGCICYVANSTDSTAIDAGAYLTAGSLDGTVTAFTAGTETVVEMLGTAIDDIAADGTGLMIILPGPSAK